MPKPKIVDVKIAFAFAHPDPAKRYTWKASRGSSLKETLAQLFKSQYNYWKDGEKDLIISELKSLNFNEPIPSVLPAVSRTSAVKKFLKKSVAK